MVLTGQPCCLPCRTIVILYREKLLDAVDVRGLLSLLLADGSLKPYRSPSGGFVQLTLTAGAPDSAFLEEKVADFRHFLPTKAQIVHYRSTPRSNGRTTPVLRFRVSSNKLWPVYNLLYPRRTRRITSAVLEILGAQAAAWLWADGAKIRRDGSIELARVGTTESEAFRVQEWLETLTGAASNVIHEYLRPRLLFSQQQASKIQGALGNYAPRTRQHLFRGEYWNVSAIRSARTELLLGAGADRPEGAQVSAMVGDPTT
jgi:hypothetical protein